MKSGNLAIVTHVNPFSSGSGQIQRVYNSLLAFAADWENITVFTLDSNRSKPERIREVLSINAGVQVKYLKYPFILPLLKPLFHFLPYLGFGKPSNWILPFVFKQLDKRVFSDYDCVLFEYWYLYSLAGKIKSKKNKVICDTHNILLGSFKEYISNKSLLPGFYKKYLINCYQKLEFEKALLNSFDVLIAINKEEEAIFKEKFPGKKVLYCPMGIKLPKFISKNEKESRNPYTIAYYGGLGNTRNTSAALEVYRAVFESPRYDNHLLTYKIIGSNTPKVLSQLAVSNPGVRVTGFVENLSLVLFDVDLAVIPFEGKYGFRSRLVELMYYGIPILTTEDAVWGMGLTPGTNIFTYNAGEVLGEKIIELLNKGEERNRIAFNAQMLVEREFTFEATYSKLSRKLNKLINETSSILS